MDNKILILNEEISKLKNELLAKETELQELQQQSTAENKTKSYSNYFSKDEVEKYCRQIILPQIGIEGQKSITNSKVLIVGVGGLGCPASQYLAAAGVGTLGLLDHDEVSISNLHRQILYGEEDLNIPKANVAAEKLTSLNSKIQCVPIKEKLNRLNCERIIREYDLVLDCTDNVPTRYLVNDVCMLLNIPLVAGNAIKFEGQILVCIPGKTPCYRCLFPTPPSLECVGSCNESGVLGAVPGVIGVLQALEAIKIICEISETSDFQKLSLFDGESSRFRHMNIRTPKSDCVCCGINKGFQLSSLPDYETWCGMDSQETIAKYPPQVLLPEDQRLSAEHLHKLQVENKPHIVLDVRPKIEYEMCRLPESWNISLKEVCSKTSRDLFFKKLSETEAVNLAEESIPILCRCGNDSQKAVQILREHNKNKKVTFYDLAGGLYAWNENVDKEFPLY